MRISNKSGVFSIRSKFSKKDSNEVKQAIKKRAILVTRLSGGIGDLIMITPAIRQIKKENPNTPFIVNTTKQYGARGVLFDVLKHNPYIDAIIESSELINYDFKKIYNFNTQQEISLETTPTIIQAIE